ncbi:hypothetical protein [Aliiroseovarius subalbicans]|uniref:hypothetical protein n=1 Tax=Aliiroseovarius subalbicans TaxID=2925840 RepID=UPI001F55BF97|nr:hypothetical protein [Aliiroseovarius subalbicans]MCI2398818.1 hypothetical protein [Aliiroseovarius subalbicans]
MSKFVAWATALVLAIIVSLPMTAPAQAEEGTKDGLFISLTTDDTWAATKAIMFAHQKVLKNGHSPVVIWMNVRAVYLADAKRPSHVHGLMAEKGTSVQDMLKAFMADGGVVLMCQACSAAAGLTEADYIEGVQMGSWPMVEGYLFGENMRTLHW